MQVRVIEGRVTGIAEGAIIGWLAAGTAPEDCYLEAVADGEGAFARARAGLKQAPDGAAGARLAFAIPIPDSLRDGRMRFLDVRPLGSERPLPGGPVIFDGGLLGRPLRRPDAGTANLGSGGFLAEGAVALDPPGRLTGWAWIPAEPQRRLRLELLAGDRFLVAITAAKLREDLKASGVGDARYGFEVDLARLLRRGPHELTVRVAGAAEPLPGGRLQVGPFAADGEVDCPGYLDDEASRARLAGLPFEHLAYNARRIAPERLVPRLINRLRRERSGLAGASLEPATLLPLPGAGPPTAAETWALQSHPQARSAPAADAAALQAAMSRGGWIFFARPTDLIHPSAAVIVAQMEGAAIVSWNRFCADDGRAGSAGTVLRRPDPDPVTLRQGAVTDTTLAVRCEVLSQAPEPVLRALADGRMHPLWFWLAGRTERWVHHPEALTSHVGPPPEIEAGEILADEPVYRALVADAGSGLRLERATAGEFPLVLVPVRRAAKTSVLIGFRNRAALTLRCLYAVARQRLSGELEVVLVDNQSDPAEAAAVAEGARRMLGSGRVVMLAYDRAFNHSAQNNLAAAAAAGDALVLLNNDVELKDPLLLEQLGAWALEPGIGTVGARLWDPRRGLGSYGHVAAAAPDPFQPPLRENADPAGSGFIHAVPGNTLALAAMARGRYLELGGLDETRFPIGYNDIDLMLRASAAGLTHLYLGHLTAEHVRGSSRTGDNEDLQALRVRQAAAALDPLRQLCRERIDTARPELQRTARRRNTADEAGAAPEPTQDADLLAALQSAVTARREVEQQRAELAEAFSRASGLVDRLGDELRTTRALGD